MRTRAGFAAEELTKDRVDIAWSCDAGHVEVGDFAIDGSVGAPERCAIVGGAEYFGLALVDDFDVSVILAKPHQIAAQECRTSLRIAAAVVAIRRLRRVNVP